MFKPYPHSWLNLCAYCEASLICLLPVNFFLQIKSFDGITPLLCFSHSKQQSKCKVFLRTFSSLNNSRWFSLGYRLVSYLILLLDLGYKCFKLTAKIRFVFQAWVDGLDNLFLDCFSLLLYTWLLLLVLPLSLFCPFLGVFSLVTHVGVDEFTRDELFAWNTFKIQLLSHAFWMENSLAVGTLSSLIIEVEYLLTNTHWLQLGQKWVWRRTRLTNKSLPEKVILWWVGVW